MSAYNINFMSSGSKCPSNWYYYPQEDSCYFISDFKTDWHEASVCIIKYFFSTLSWPFNGRAAVSDMLWSTRVLVGFVLLDL